jgi:sulfite reductase beta subunit-like hemoprotein
MMRLKVPQGMLTAEQLNALAGLGEVPRGFGHITTRQNIQLRFVKAARG